MARTRIKKKIKTLVDSYLNDLEGRGLEIQAAYIFGSQARGTAHDASDVDVCIISPKFGSPHRALQWLWREKPLFFSQIEPVGYSKKEFSEYRQPLVAEIKKDGIRIR
ncbi:MAG: nucleotidyltransferase domain-containing protein [Candidatus Uhrbacteria bacterium]|nr:nucleotidyltransferase domain-containing protein [Candidatus Uhrbacteria bacterium]